MARLIIENIESLKVAKELASFYEGHGEQTADDWLSEHGMRASMSDVARPGGCIEVDKKNDTVTIYCRKANQ